MSGNVRTNSRGFTIVELLVVVAIIAVLIAMLLPSIARARDAALINSSKGNVRNLQVATQAYLPDFKDKIPQFCRDDWGYLEGCGSNGSGCAPAQACQNYQVNYGCTSQQILGFAASGGIWGYWVNGPNCGFSVSTTCGQNASVYIAFSFSGGDAGFGSFRIMCIKSFNSYVGGKYYDKVFYAPKDSVNLALADQYFQLPDEFTYQNGKISFGSYCWAGAMGWNPRVMGGCDKCEHGFVSPNGGSSATTRNANAYVGPTAGMAKYPAQKAFILEHTLLQNAPPQKINANFAGGGTEWYFNQKYDSNPVIGCVDGSIVMKGMWALMDSDKRAAGPSGDGCGLWLRDTPLGPAGYYGSQSYDFLVATSGGILTRGGICGRDWLDADSQ